MGEHRGANGRVYRIDPPVAEPVVEQHADVLGRDHFGADLAYYETGRDELYVTVAITDAVTRARTGCRAFFGPTLRAAQRELVERSETTGVCTWCWRPMDPAGRTVEHPDRHPACARYREDAPMETPL